jgi:hypothetical protein
MLPEVEEKVKPLIEEFRVKMKAKGYPERLIEKAIERAKGWVAGISKFADARYPELQRRIQEEMFPEALEEHGEKWIKGWMEAVKGIIETKSGRIGEVVG